MNNAIQPGNVIDYAPARAISSGGGCLIGDQLGIAVTDVATGATGSFELRGVFEHAAATGATGQTWSPGENLYWDDTNHVLTKTSSGNKLVAFAWLAKDSATEEGTFKLRPGQ